MEQGASGAPTYDVLRMSRALDEPLPAPSLPADVRLRPFRDEDAGAVHALLEEAYRAGAGSVTSFDDWLPALLADAEFDRDLLLVAEAAGRPVGAVLCWTSAFVKDLAVEADRRGQGLGRALVLAACAALRDRGAERVELKVHGDNVPALRLYTALGFRVVERLPAA